MKQSLNSIQIHGKYLLIFGIEEEDTNKDDKDDKKMIKLMQ